MFYLVHKYLQTSSFKEYIYYVYGEQNKQERSLEALQPYMSWSGTFVLTAHLC